jgi:predicted DCC family thiol-disulfide oxidoreductase YuxK
MVNEKRLILFYDGDCGFCNRSVQFVLNNDKRERFYFSALQSEWTHTFFESQNIQSPDLSTFYFWDGNKLHERSTAGLRVLTYLRFPWPMMFVFIIAPKFIRDWVYNQIAKRRHRIQSGFCALPTAQQKKRFLYS